MFVLLRKCFNTSIKSWPSFLKSLPVNRETTKPQTTPADGESEIRKNHSSFDHTYYIRSTLHNKRTQQSKQIPLHVYNQYKCTLYNFLYGKNIKLFVKCIIMLSFLKFRNCFFVCFFFLFLFFGLKLFLFYKSFSLGEVKIKGI